MWILLLYDGSFGWKNSWYIYHNTDLHDYQKKFVVFRHCFWSTFRINRSCALSEYDSLNSCTVDCTIFYLPILLRKRVTAAVFAGALSIFISNCISNYSSNLTAIGICLSSISIPECEISMLFSDKLIKTIAWPSAEQKGNPNGLRAVHNSTFRSWMAQKWHRLCIFNSSILKQEALRFVYIQTARDETTNANAVH